LNAVALFSGVLEENGEMAVMLKFSFLLLLVRNMIFTVSPNGNGPLKNLKQLFLKYSGDVRLTTRLLYSQASFSAREANWPNL
jgi:hypothetical protein